MRQSLIVLQKSGRYFGLLAGSDIIISGIAFAIYGWETSISLFGDLTVLETALLFILGGFSDFSESFSGINIKKLIRGATKSLRNKMGPINPEAQQEEEEPEYSPSRHRDAQVRGASYIMAGVWFVLLAIAMFEVGIR
jgi:hypothetical protein